MTTEEKIVPDAVPNPTPLAQDLLTIPEIAYLVGFERGTVERWRLRTRKDNSPIFIDPDDYIGSTPVFRLERVVAWCEESGRTYDVKAWRKHRADGGFRRRADV